MTRNYSSELDRNVRETLFNRMVQRADTIVRKAKTGNMSDLQDQISKLIEAVDMLGADLGRAMQPSHAGNCAICSNPGNAIRSC